MRPSRIIGYVFLFCFLWITFCAFLFTVIRVPVFLTFPRDVIIYSYGMIAPYQEAIAPHGQIDAECMNAAGTWQTIDLAPFYPQIFGERNAREYFAMYSFSDDASNNPRRAQYAGVLQHLLIRQGIDCTKIRLAWDMWPAMTGPFDFLHLPVFTTRLPLYGY